MDFACVIDPQYWPHGELPEQFKLDFETHQWRRFAEPGEYYGGVVDWRAVVVRCVVRLPVEICLSSLVVSGGDCGGRGRTNVRNFCHPQWVSYGACSLFTQQSWRRSGALTLWGLRGVIYGCASTLSVIFRCFMDAMPIRVLTVYCIISTTAGAMIVSCIFVLWHGRFGTPVGLRDFEEIPIIPVPV